MDGIINVEELEFVAECQEMEERVAFTLADLYGWDDETIFIDTSIYLNRPKEVNWAIVLKDEIGGGRRLNPAYHIHIRTQEDRTLKEPLRLSIVKKYADYRFEAEFSNHVVRTGSFRQEARRMEEMGKPFCSETEFEQAEVNPRGIVIKNDIFISAKRVWEMSDEYVHYGCNADDFDREKFQAVKNIPILAKPTGGFWASPARSDGRQSFFGWEAFCNAVGYQPKHGLYRQFYFCIDIHANVFRIETADDYNALPKTMIADAVGKEREFIDFEECLRQGIDAIEYAYSAAHRNENVGEEMDIRMAGWDCDSILIMNPEIILQESFLEKIDRNFLVKG
ncbi:MAG: hypothetical protein NC419_06545 [Muribaculaceae bacterium]|nr:hypothetical protein [Muribaculaceae bacterium]